MSVLAQHHTIQIGRWVLYVGPARCHRFCTARGPRFFEVTALHVCVGVVG